MIQVFLPMVPPTATGQMRAVRVVGGKPVFYDPPAVIETRAKLEAALAPHRPAQPIEEPIRLVVKWLFPRGECHTDGAWKTTRPDIDNSMKLLLDAMTRLGYWRDDAQVCSMILEKFWAETPGIFLRVESIF